MFGLSLQLNKTRPCAAPLCNERSLVCRRVPCISPSPGASKQALHSETVAAVTTEAIFFTPSLSLPLLTKFTPHVAAVPSHHPWKAASSNSWLTSLSPPSPLPSWESVPPSSSYKTHSYSYATHMTPNCTRGRHYREYWLFCTNVRVLWFEYLNNCKHYEITLLPKFENTPCLQYFLPQMWPCPIAFKARIHDNRLWQFPKNGTEIVLPLPSPPPKSQGILDKRMSCAAQTL